MERPGGYVETRARSRWGTFWRVLFVIWAGIFAFDVIRLMLRAHGVTEGAGVLAQLAVRNVLSTRLIESAVLWAVGAVVLGLACYATRGQRVWKPIDPGGMPASSRPQPRNEAEARGDRAVLALVVVILIFGVGFATVFW